MTALPNDLEEAIEEIVEEKVAEAIAISREENEMLREENQELHSLEDCGAELEEKDLHHHLSRRAVRINLFAFRISCNVA